MKLFTTVLLLVAICYKLYQFVCYSKKRKGVILFPVAEEEWTAIRKYPQDKASRQKENRATYALILTFIIILYVLGLYFGSEQWAFDLMLLLLLINSSNLVNGFAFVEDGLLSEGRFIPWNNIKDFSFVPIDSNHKYYGYSQEVNHGYELRIKERFSGTSCIVTTEEMKVKLSYLLSEHMQ
ncbi:hypothetical protein [Robertmurraya andreesenii]|uniref:DUF5673 domain-containing protein n=1 Tax=Anoxybacillus andreesenii TaxID=1325932 RepID=A0ABT9V161_9BACL|nr:hypothetical protein [Robertmurraya andreesenii]MDQ0154688.1 hypothetical protein [Robertmurraya andreesenii]